MSMAVNMPRFFADEDIREEILNGISYMAPSPKPSHGDIQLNLATVFKSHIWNKGYGCRVYSEMDIQLTEKDIVKPDLAVICNTKIITEDGIFGTPDLIVEVLSPSTRRRDKGYKFNLYESCGVKEYWMIDIARGGRIIETYVLEDGKYRLDNIYELYKDYEIEEMTDQEKSELVHEFKTHLFSDLTIKIKDVFRGI